MPVRRADVDGGVLLLLFQPCTDGPKPHVDLQLVEILEYLHMLLHTFTGVAI